MIKIPKEFFPKFECDLIRLGNQHDGGYVVSKKSIENSKQLITFGLSNDWLTSYWICYCAYYSIST